MTPRKKELKDPVLTPIAEEVLKRRYLIKDDDGKPTETPKDMFYRVAKTISDVEKEYGNDGDVWLERFYNLMAEGKWLPNSPTLMNAGRPLGQLSACFVLPVEDSLSNGKDGIYDTLTSMALIHQSGGGTGFSFSRLRPSGSIVRSTTGVASGPVSFMSLYDASTDVVKQGGTRRGANMGILRVDHPDVEKFIDCKQDTSKITNFNISVAITDEFMGKLDAGDEDAVRLWNKLCENAWRTGEPGLFFIDEANRHNPVPQLGDYEATNPCGEQPLLPYDVCNLGSLNVAKYCDVSPGDGVQWKHCIDWATMADDIYTSVRFLDNVIDANQYPLQEITDLAQKIRRIGNGVMGFADLLIKLRIPYDSREAIEVANTLAKYFVDQCKLASENLAIDRGAYPAWDGEGMQQRNCNVTTIAPTGTISMIAGCSGGIEPIFAIGFYRNQAGMNVLDTHPSFASDIRLKYKYSDEEIGQMALGELPTPKDINWYRTSADVSPEMHVRMQAEWQKHICSAISKTINMPETATVDDVDHAYRLAYDLRCKGVTVYRDGCRPGQVLSTKKVENVGSGSKAVDRRTPKTDDDNELSSGRPSDLDGTTSSIDSPIGKMYVTVNRVSGKPYEVFINVGKAGGTSASFSEAVGRLISLGLRNGITVEQVHRQLRGISSDRAFGLGTGKVASGPDAVAKILERYMASDKTQVKKGAVEFAACPDCQSELVFEEGCYKCHSCGYGGC